MSRNDWEAGTIKLPTRAWAPFKKALREASNQRRDAVLRKAETLQAKLAVEFKGKRNVPGHQVNEFLRRQMVGTSDEEMAQAAVNLAKASLKDGSASRTKKITQAMLDTHVAPKATNKTLYYEGGDWSISLNEEQRSVHWYVSENNHAVDRSRESQMGKTLFRELQRIDYGSRKILGGVIVGNNEYNEDCEYAGGGANYIAASFGKAGELERGW